MSSAPDHDSTESATPQDLVHPLEDRPSSEDLPGLLLMLALTFACALVITPYRDIIVPRMLLFAGGISLSLLLLPLVLQRHHIIILLLVTYLPFSKALPGTFGNLARTFNMTNVLLGLSIAGWLINSAMHHHKLTRRSALDLPLAAFMFLASLSLIRGFMLTHGRDPIETVFSMKRWLTPMALYFIVYNTLRTLKLNYGAFVSLCITGGTVGLIGIKKFYMDFGPRSSIERMRLDVVSGTNHLGFIMSAAIFLLLAVLYSYRKDRRFWVLIVPILACLQTMRLTFSRGAQIGLVAGLMCFVLPLSRRLFLVLTFLLILVARDPSIIPQRISGRMSHTFEHNEGPLTERLDKSSAQRLFIWGGGMRLSADYPLLGTGYGTFPYHIGRYAPMQAGRDAHNTYLIVAAEMGLPALVLFLWFFFGGAVFAWRVYWMSAHEPLIRMMALGYLGFWGANMAGNMFGTRFDSTETSAQFFIYTAVIMGCYEMLKAEPPERPTPPPPPPEVDEESEIAPLPQTTVVHAPPQPRGTPLREWKQTAHETTHQRSFRR